ncbi:hypothetical protein VP01_991g3 [Puccinia sorghi]|uniref:Uncharacterized protein n=1 Tax=Puccinia sorghi TaxID=27349 RepID=A0A0L6U5D8_9BASI|nr:hypothetical protein VP01_991g3 [Puccinia sorghi]
MRTLLITRHYSTSIQSTNLIQRYNALLTTGTLKNDQQQTIAIYKALLSPSTIPHQTSLSAPISETALIRIINQTQHTADRDAPHLEQSKLSVEEASEILSLKHKPSGYLPPQQDRARNKALSQGGKDPRDPALNGPNFVLAQVARDLILTQGWVLAFDEIQMVDVAGAGILSRVLEWYWRLGGVVIGTSNRLPEHMYDQGVQKSTVAPFLDRLKIKSPVVLLDSDVDWRLNLSSGSAEGEQASTLSHWYQNIDSGLWKELLDKHLPFPEKTELIVYGRNITVNRSDPSLKSAAFSYQELCEAPLGPADYLKICSTFETIMIEGVPVFTTFMKNEARRLITFIDAAYECSVKLFVTSDTSIDRLFFPDAQDQRNQTDAIELETLADVVEELSGPYRPNVSSYQDLAASQQKSSDEPQRMHNKIENRSIEKLAIFSGQDEKYAFDRATSRLFELTKCGGRDSKAWTPLELDLTLNPSPSSTTTPLPAKAEIPYHFNETFTDSDHTAESVIGQQSSQLDHHEKDDESNLTRPKISEIHFWGIIQWGKRAGRWGQGVEIYNKKPKP